MKKKPSKKHHYLPRYYLNGFTNGEGSFFVYDKRSDKIHSTNPSDSFFQNDLNTATLRDGRKSDFLEEMYTESENRFWPSLNKIRNSTYDSPIDPLDRMNLYFFLLVLHWRLPSNIKFSETLSEKFFHGESIFDYFEIKSKKGGSVPIELIESLKASLVFKKSAKMIIPLAPFFKDKDWSQKLDSWQFTYTGDKESWYIVGDNPIITLGYNDHDPINCLKEFIFPVSGKLLLISGETYKGKMLPPTFAVKHNIAIIERAQRFVACQRKDFLEALVGLYKLRIQQGKKGEIIPDLFNAAKTGK